MTGKKTRRMSTLKWNQPVQESLYADIARFNPFHVGTTSRLAHELFTQACLPEQSKPSKKGLPAAPKGSITVRTKGDESHNDPQTVKISSLALSHDGTLVAIGTECCQVLY